MAEFKDDLSLKAISFLLDQLIRKQLKQLKDESSELRGMHPILVGTLEKQVIESVMAHCNGNKLKAARILGINRNTLHNKLKNYTS